MKKGFTLVELLGVIVVLAIIASLTIVTISNVTSDSRKSLYKNFEANLESAGRHYIIENPDKIPSINTNLKLTYQELEELDLIDTMKDTNGEICKDSYVTITRNPDKEINLDIDYNACLICSNYKSENCSNT